MIKLFFKCLIYLLAILFVLDLFAETSDIKIPIDKLDRDTLCPTGTQHANDKHIVYLIDTTMELKIEQFTSIDRLLLDEKALMNIKPYTRISIINLNGIDKQASEISYSFSKCRPRNGLVDSKFELDKANWFSENDGLMTQMWKNKFLKEYEDAKTDLRDQPEGDYTQLIEMIFELSRMPGYDFGDNYSERKLVIVSDLIQHSPKNGLSFVSSCERNKSCPTWDEIKSGPFGTLIKAMLPRFGNNPPSVHILYLHSESNPNLNSGVRKLWDGYFKDAGISNFSLEIESNR